MGSKIIAIFLLIVGAGLVLWFFTSGDAAKLGNIVSFSNSSSTLTAANASSSSSSTIASASSSASTTAKPAAPNPIAEFFAMLFPARSTGTFGPTISTGQTGGGGTTGTIGASGVTSSAGVGETVPDTVSIPTGYTRAQLSPYFHLVRFAGVGISQITLSTNSSNQPTSTVDITGWEIKTNRGGEYIPQAVNIYNPESANPPSDIVLLLNQSNQVYLYSNAAPANVRISECMGYLNTTKQFNPAFPGNCPTVASRAQISSFTGQCQNYILSLGGCSTANLQSTQIPRNDYACQQYIENNFSYESCIDNHTHDVNFLSNQWRLWMGGSPLDRYHDNVALLDRNGLVVDTYTY